MTDKTYGVRISFNHGNAINIELKGCGQKYIKPGKDYYFEEAPIGFINYLVQLRRVGVTYKITNDKKGCYETINLHDYDKFNSRSIMGKLRKPIEIPKEEVVEETKSQILTQDDIISVEEPTEKPQETTTENPKENTESEQDSKEQVEIPENSTDENIENFDEENHEENYDEPEIKKYSEKELSKMSQDELLEISNSLGLELTKINTKKEIRNAILEAQK